MLELVRWLIFVILLTGQSTGVESPPPVDAPALANSIKPGMATPGAIQAGAVPFPLELGRTWVYSQEFYAPSSVHRGQIVTATFILTETVVEIVQDGTTLRAHVHPSRELLYVPPDYSFSTDVEYRDFSYVVDGSLLWRYHEVGTSPADKSLYRQLLYDFPLALGKEWCPNNPSYPEVCSSAGMRRVVDTGVITTPAGTFTDCYQTHEFYNSGGPYIWFCPGVGVVAETYDHGGTPFGHHKTLINYLIVQQ